MHWKVQEPYYIRQLLLVISCQCTVNIVFVRCDMCLQVKAKHFQHLL
jgi:hypothetical protein